MRSNAAIGIVLTPDKKKVLLVKRQDVPIWVLPGGGIDLGEASKEAVIREVLEETGLTVEVIRKVAEYTPINRLAKKTETFECKKISGELLKGEETREIDYFSINQLPKNLFFLHKEWLLEALLNKPEVIERELKNVTYWNLAKYFLLHPLWVLGFLKTLFLKKN